MTSISPYPGLPLTGITLRPGNRFIWDEWDGKTGEPRGKTGEPLPIRFAACRHKFGLVDNPTKEQST
jgi:hypothetical protein